jgi:hypothetical protein
MTPYSLVRFTKEEPLIAERMRYGTTAEDRQVREDGVRKQLEKIGRKLKDDSLISTAYDKMMRELEILEKGSKLK